MQVLLQEIVEWLKERNMVNLKQEEVFNFLSVRNITNLIQHNKQYEKSRTCFYEKKSEVTNGFYVI